MEEKRRPRQCPPPPVGPYPWLVFHHGKGFKNQTFYTPSHPPSNTTPTTTTSSVRSVPELRKKEVWNSCHGWLILSNDDNDDQFSLFNPLTFESILLPPLKPDAKSCFNACTLSSPPSDPSSTLFLFDRGLRRILFCRLENQHWIERSYEEEIEAIGENKYNANYLLRPVSCNGKLYALTKRKLVSIDTIEQHSDPVIRLLGIRLPRDYESLSIRTKTDMVESGGELFTVITMHGGMKYTDAIGIEIFKLDFSCMVWERMESVKDRAFFLCNNYAISCNAVCSDEVRGNCVYFIRDEDKSSYNIDE